MVASGSDFKITTGLRGTYIIDKAGKFFVTADLSGSGSTESAHLSVAHLSSYSTDLKATNLDYLTNHSSGLCDLIGIKGLEVSDLVKVYTAVNGAGYFSVTRDGMLESSKRLAVKFKSDVSIAPIAT